MNFDVSFSPGLLGILVIFGLVALGGFLLVTFIVIANRARHDVLEDEEPEDGVIPPTP